VTERFPATVKETTMGRMFRIVTEGPLEAVRSGALAAVTPKTAELIAEADPFVAGEAPYIEIGGGASASNIQKKPAIDPLTITPAPVKTLPPKVPVSEAYLSVALQGMPTKPVQTLSPVAADIVAYHYPEHAVSHEYRTLAGEVRKQIGIDGPKAIQFTAASSDQGTTTVLVNLAVTLAKEPGTRVLVLDADFDRPTAARKLGLADLPGFGDVLAQTMPLAWVIQPTAVPKLQVLGTGKLNPEHHATLAVDLPRIITQLRQWFDWILVDTGMWGERPQRDSASPAFDGVYLVTRHHDQDRHAGFAKQIHRAGGLLKGYVTTRG
jgi:MinD-like ATPase involved in chromosome partitioning or flagellar assembly